MNHAVIETSLPISLHEGLRAATTEQHQAVDRLFGAYNLSDPAQYAEFLTLQAAALLPLEAALERAGIAQALPDWAQRRRAAALRADLHALGRVAATPLSPPVLHGGAEVLGAAYVLEGSRLGAALLLRQVGPALPDAFLRHGAGAGLWRSFLGHLAQLPQAGWPAAQRGARLAFEQFLAGPSP